MKHREKNPRKKSRKRKSETGRKAHGSQQGEHFSHGPAFPVVSWKLFFHATLLHCTMRFAFVLTTKSSAIADGSLDAPSVEILSNAAQMYEKSHLKRLTLKVTQGHRDCRCSICHISLPISGL